MTSNMRTYENNMICWTNEYNRSYRARGPCIIYNDGDVVFSQSTRSPYYRHYPGPSQIRSDGYIIYNNIKGEIHRTDGPAIIRANGSKVYFINNCQVPALEFFLKYGVL